MPLRIAIRPTHIDKGSQVFTAGGLPPLVDAPDAVYEKLFGKTAVVQIVDAS